MFYTRTEQMERTGYWCTFVILTGPSGDFLLTLILVLMKGAALASVDSAAYGCSVIPLTSGLFSWQWLVIIIGTLTFITSVLFWFFFPSSPVNARFLTTEERVKVVLRVRENQAGVENKTFKGEQ